MKKEFYEVCGISTENCERCFKVLAAGHVQHQPGSTRLIDVSAAGRRKIDEARGDGLQLRVSIAGRWIGMENE